MYTTLSPCDMCKPPPSLIIPICSITGQNPRREERKSPSPQAKIKTGTGACLLYGIARVVIGENRNFLGGEAYLRQRGVEVLVLDDPRCRALMDRFVAERPDLWNEDIGVEERVYSKEGLEPQGKIS